MTATPQLDVQLYKVPDTVRLRFSTRIASGTL